MFQKEVGDRIIANYNNSNYGRLSILANWKLNIKKICDIKPNSFLPKPKIDSSLLLFTPREDFYKINDLMINYLFMSEETGTRWRFKTNNPKELLVGNPVYDDNPYRVCLSKNVLEKKIINILKRKNEYS